MGAETAPGSETAGRVSAIVASSSGAWTTTGLFGGVTDPGRGSLAVQLGWRRALSSRRGFLLQYAADVVPLELALGTRLDKPMGGSGTVYGAGLDPLGLEARFGSGRLRPYLALRTGIRVFSKPVPNPSGTRFNFVLDTGAGLQLRLRDDRWAFLGVELHHLSNGGLGQFNPSLNLFTLRAGLTLRR